ncbi:HAD family hydrolase [Natronoarchaeum sp. GCM10025703]|uniref:HAD family hydrolase n=1 Tax=unclassified Natronoarchaeum TaxID=2620183 RepID=UPI00361CF4A9
MAVSFDLFGTLVSVDRPESPADAVGSALASRGVDVPADFPAAYREVHIDAPDGAEVPLPAHVAAALASLGVRPENNVVRRAVVAAFDPEVETRSGAVEAVEAAAERGPVGILSNCSVPELVPKSLLRSDVDRSTFDVVVSSTGCGWRKPDSRAFESFASRLDIDVETVTHVGDDAATDGGIESVGGRALLLDEHSLADIPALLDSDGRLDEVE